MQLNLKSLVFLILIAGLILTGCGAPAAATVAPATAAPATAAPAATQAATEPPAAALPVELWTYYGDTGPAAACVKTAAEDFNAAQSQYVLNIRNLAFTDFNQQLTTAIAAGETPDLIIVDNPDNARYAAAGALEDLTAYVKEWGQADQYLPGPWNSTLWEGKNFGIPLGSNTVSPVDQYRPGYSRRFGYQ